MDPGRTLMGPAPAPTGRTFILGAWLCQVTTRSRSQVNICTVPLRRVAGAYTCQQVNRGPGSSTLRSTVGTYSFERTTRCTSSTSRHLIGMLGSREEHRRQVHERAGRTRRASSRSRDFSTFSSMTASMNEAQSMASRRVPVCIGASFSFLRAGQDVTKHADKLHGIKNTPTDF